MEYTSVVGTLTHVPYGPEGSAHYFELEDGTFLNIKFAGGFTQAELMTDVLNRKISLNVSDVEINGFRVVPDIDKFYMLIRNDQSLLMANAAKVKKHIGVFRQITFKEGDPPLTEEALTKYQKQIDNHARIIKAYYRRYAGHVWDVEVRGYVMMGNENAHPPYYAQNDIRAFMSENPELFEDFAPNYFHVQGGYSQGYCGQGNLPGNRSVTYINYACGTKTMIHELGHNFGLHHASTHTTGNPDAEPPVPDKIVEYGDKTSVMSSTQSITGLNSVEMVRLGLEMDRETLVVNTTQQVFIAPIELSERDMREGEWQNVRVGDGAEPYHVSIRKAQENGWFYSTYRSDEATAFVHHYKRDRHSIRMLADIKEGGGKTLPTGVRIEHKGYENECARINIIFNGEPAPEDKPFPTGFPVPMDTVYVAPEHNGAWYDPKHTGEGFDFQIKEDKMVLYWYTYNHDHRTRRFFYATAPITGDTGPVKFDIFTTDGGTWDDPTQADRSVPAGTGQLYFYDGQNGVFHYDAPNYGRGSIELIPVALSSGHPSNGSYYQKSRNGEGFTVQCFDQMPSPEGPVDRCVAYWYSYGPKWFGSPTYYGNTCQRWYACVGAKNDEGSYDMDIFEAHTNDWMELRDDPRLTNVGNAKLSIVDDNNITFDYDINADPPGQNPVRGAGTFELVKLF